jgi:hypothetical protein
MSAFEVTEELPPCPPPSRAELFPDHPMTHPLAPMAIWAPGSGYRPLWDMTVLRTQPPPAHWSSTTHLSCDLVLTAIAGVAIVIPWQLWASLRSSS